MMTLYLEWKLHYFLIEITKATQAPLDHVQGTEFSEIGMCITASF